MVNNKAQIEINGKDNASPVLRDIQNTLGSVGTKVTALSFAFNQVTTAIGAVVDAFRPMVDAAIAMEKIESTMRVAAGSSAAAGKELAFVRSEAQRLGLSFTDVAGSYAKFAVASKGTALEGEQTRKVFSSIATASAALKLSSDETNGALTAVQQMMSKGTVSSEELRGQLGERLPGAFNLAAKAMGVTTAQLGKMLEQGQISAADMLPKLAAELEKTFGPEAGKGAESLQGSINKFNDSIKGSAATLGASVTPQVKVVLGWVSDLAKGFVNLVSYLEIFGIALGANFARAAVVVEGFINGDAFTETGRKNIQTQLEAITAGADESFAALEKRYGVHQETMDATGASGAANAAKTGQQRRDAAKKTGDDLIKIEEAYAKATGNAQQQMTAEYNKSYEERKKALTAYYAQLKSEATNNNAEEQIEKLKKQRLLELEKQHGEDIKLVKLRLYADAIADRKAALDAEIAAINLAAAQKKITAQEAERQITMLTVAAAQDQYQARKNVADKALEIYGRDSEEYKARLKEMETAHSAYTQANLAAYKKYADEIKKIDQDIKDFRQSIQDKIRAIQQKGMTDAQKYADTEMQYREAQSKASEALSQKDYETAEKYNKKAIELAEKLADKPAAGNTELEKEQALKDGIQNATTKLNESEQQGLQILEAKKQANQDALTKLEQIRDMKIDPKNLAVNMDQGALAAVKSEIAALTADATKTITVVYKSTGSSGEASYSDTASGYFAGGKITNGSPLKDSVNAMLARNEWVINNKATGFWGDQMMAAINAPFSAAGQRLQMMVNSNGAAPANPPNLGSINLNIGGGSFPVQADIDVLSQLDTALRRMKRSRPQ